ncbi:MAG TPA: hypothetical protein VLX61_02640 [Anaerolineales bacterium]|nr:hypothetical protein [Anaerolineales bacterium]
MNLYPRSSAGASVSAAENGFRLTIPASSQEKYRLAQLDGYGRLPRRSFTAQPPSRFSLRARASSQSLPGTWGFGLWNDPFGLSFGFGENLLSLPALPNAVWFFHASPQNHLSFRNDKPAQGFLAQAFSSPRLHPLLLPIGLMFPFSRRRARQLLARVVAEDAAIMSVDRTLWHHYRLEWRPDRSSFWVDGNLVLDTPVSPRPPLGLVLWIDNQYAAFMPDGKLKWGLEKNPTEAWLEIEDVTIEI